jgi:hypothetical protein
LLFAAARKQEPPKAPPRGRKALLQLADTVNARGGEHLWRLCDGVDILSCLGGCGSSLYPGEDETAADEPCDPDPYFGPVDREAFEALRGKEQALAAQRVATRKRSWRGGAAPIMADYSVPTMGGRGTKGGEGGRG